MNKFAFAFLTTLGLSGCVAVPVAEPGYYAAPPTVVVQPYGYYRYGGHRHHGPRHHW